MLVPMIMIIALASCKEQWETEDYKAGYYAGYEEALYEICEAWERNLSAAIHDRFVPQICR